MLAGAVSEASWAGLVLVDALKRANSFDEFLTQEVDAKMNGSQRRATDGRVNGRSETSKVSSKNAFHTRRFSASAVDLGANGIDRSISRAHA